MTTVADWIAETRDHLDGDAGVEANLLKIDYVAGSGSISLTNALGNIGPGAWLSVGTNTMLVLASDPLTKTATVLAGQRGSVDANAPLGSLVRVSPRFTDYAIWRQLNRTLGALSSPRNGLYAVGSIEFDYAPAVEVYDLAGVTDFLRPLEVRRQTVGPSLAWPSVETSMWDILRSAPAEFASGISLRVRGPDVGYGVQLVYAKKFTALPLTPTADVSVTGIMDTAHDIPPMGAALGVMGGREIGRNDEKRQGSTRRANEVPPGAINASPRSLAGQYAERIKQESDRLRSQYPVTL